MSIGILLALLTSVLSTAQNTMLKLLAKYNKSEIVKSAVEKEADEKAVKEADIMMGLITSWSSAFVAFLAAFLVMVWFGIYQKIPELPNNFWMAVLEKVPLSTLAIWSYALAHRKGDMSLISPLLAITPAIIVVIAPFLINQTANLPGIVGVLFIVIGAYFLNFSQRKNGFLEPLKELWKDHGARFMMLTATIYAVTSVIDAVGVKSGGNNFAGAVLWSASIFFGMFVVLTPFALYFTMKLRRSYCELPQVQDFLGSNGIIKMVLTGFFNGSGEIAQMTAMTFLLAAYVNAIKRFSMVLGVAVGAILGEKNFKDRLTGSLIMLLGVILIIISATVK